MSNILIGIGGTGAKAVEATLHLLASGLMRQGKLAQDETVDVAFIDADNDNGTRLRVEAALADYIGSYPASPDAGFLGPRLRKISVWNPVAGRGRTFAEYLRISPAVTNKPADQLGRALFEIDQLYGELDVGFRGAPSLGTLVLADAFNSLRSAVPPDTVWSTLENALNLDNAAGRETKVVLVGSLFGGMGAAGLPAVAKFLREKYPVSQFPKLHIALGTVLPHFTFPSDRIEGPHARHEDFIATSKNTLLHYIRHNLDKQVNAVYVFGHDAAVQMPNCALGRGEQKNPAHFIDLYAGLATLHFWQEWKPAPVGTPQTIFQRANRDLVDGQGANTIRWNQLPWQDPINDPKRMTQMTNFCLALIQSFGPRLLQFTKDRSFPATEAPWIMDYFGGDPARIRAEEGKIEHLRSYAKHYLLWLAQVQYSITQLAGSTALDDMLVNAGNYANLSEQANPAANARRLVLDYDETQAVFKRLAQAHSDNPCSGLYPTTVASRGEPETLSLIWRRLCGKKRRSAGASQSATDAFFSELYRACG